jgi:hypothetical protein
VRLEKVIQSLIKGPILTSKASCFSVPLIVKLDSSSIKIHALLDSRASTCFMDIDFVDCYKLPFVIKQHLILVKVINGRFLISGDVIHETTPLDIILERYYSIVTFNVIKSLSNPVILGLS